jgi:hypothetical protein
MKQSCRIDLGYFKENAHLKTRKEWAEYYNCGVETVSRWADRLEVFPKIPIREPVSEETKRKISEKRKEWMKNNPEKHPWRNKNRLKSEPCERAKEFLTKLGIPFISEFQPEIEDRYFSVDIAMPDKMIALEVNGNQHYERDGRLKPYYQERHNLLKLAGWNVFEIHYSACFNLEKWADFVNQILNTPHKNDFDYFNYAPKEKKIPYDNCFCGEQKCKGALRCNSCFKKRESSFIKRTPKKERRARANPAFNNCKCGNLKQFASKICSNCYDKENLGNWPSLDEMSRLVWEIPTIKLKGRFNVSDVAIGKFCKRHGIAKPPRGYWAKVASKKLEQLGGIEPLDIHPPL